MFRSLYRLIRLKITGRDYIHIYVLYLSRRQNGMNTSRPKSRVVLFKSASVSESYALSLQHQDREMT
jgi:hypothetical protein